MAANFPPSSEYIQPIEVIRGRCQRSERYTVWIWNRLNQLGCEFARNMQLFDIDILIDFLKFNPSALEELKRGQNHLLPDDEFDFIGNNRRILLALDHTLNTEISKTNTRHGSFLDEKKYTLKLVVIAKIDTWNVPSDAKISFLREFKENWNLAQINNTEYKWLRKDRESKLSYFIDWVRQKNPYYHLINDAHNLVDSELMEIYFDSFHENKFEKFRTFEQFKRAWATKNYREKLKGKKQCNIALSTSAITILENLSKRHGYPKAKILEILLIGEKREGHYISKKLKEIELLERPITASSLGGSSNLYQDI